jgi:hypothetical protein
MVCYHVSQTPPISYVFSRASAAFMMNFTFQFVVFSKYHDKKTNTYAVGGSSLGEKSGWETNFVHTANERKILVKLNSFAHSLF